MRDMEREKQIQEWESKGARWCAEQLWTARLQRHKAILKRNEYSFGERGDRSELLELRVANKNMAQVMKEHNIEPERLIVTYMDDECTAEEYERDDDCKYGCENCHYFKETKNIETIPFYSWGVTDCCLHGIIKDFKTINLVVISIVDAMTHTKLYEYKEEDDNE